MAPQRVVVTGAAGYVGSVLVSHLLALGYHVTALDSFQYGGDALMPHLHHPRFRLHVGDVRDRSLRGEALSDADAVVHLAAIVGFPACDSCEPRDVWGVNYEATIDLVREAEIQGVQRFICASSYSNYGVAEDNQIVTETSRLCPRSLYAETKVAAETAIRELGPSLSMRPVLLRFATLFGLAPRMRFDLMVNQFVLDAYSTRRITLFQPQLVRSFLHVFDAARAITLTLATEDDLVSGATFNVGAKAAITTKRQVAEMVAKRLPGTAIIVDERAFDGDIRSLRLGCEKIRRALSFSATVSVEEGIDEIATALEARYYHAPDSDYHRNARLV